MKILISSDGPHAHYYIRLGLARVFTAMGHEVVMWETDRKPALDAFDEFEPDIFIGQTYNVSRAVKQAISERPWMKVIMKASDWGSETDPIDTNKYPILKVKEDEKKLLLKLHEETGKPDYVYIHYHPHWIEGTHGHWAKAGIPVYSQLSAADIFEYTNGQNIGAFRSDIVFVGGYWPYKAQVLDKYLLPLCSKEKNYRVKIFGNSNWPVPHYCGYLDGHLTKDMLASATVCPNLHEPHSQVFGWDIIERPFKLLANKCFVVSDYVAGLDYLFGVEDKMVLCKTPEEFIERVDYFIKNPHERIGYINRGYKEVIAKHTYFHRVAEIFARLDMEDESIRCIKVYEDISNKMRL